MKRILYVALGMALGIAVTVVATPAQQQPAANRLSEVSAGYAMKRPAVFVKDSKTGGCWLVVGYTTGDASPSVAVAPPSACQ